MCDFCLKIFNKYSTYLLLCWSTVKVGDKELFGHPRIVPYLMPNVPYHKQLTKVQGQSTQTGFFELALRDRNI